MNSQRKRKHLTFPRILLPSAIAIMMLISPQQTLATISANASGATFPAPFITTTMSAFTGVNPGYQLNYISKGSGGGQTDLFNNATQFGASDAPLTDAQRLAHPGILHIPETIGSVTLSYTIQNATGPAGCPSPYSRCLPKGLHLSAGIIAEIYLGNITYWDDAAIKAINPSWSAFLPHNPITTVHRCDSSGTTFVFTSFLDMASPTFRKGLGNGTSVNWGSYGTPTGVCGSGNAGVAAQVLANPNYIGYVELNYALGNSLSYASVNEASDGAFVAPSLASTQAAVTAGAGSLPTASQSWAHVSLLNESATGAYPIASFSYFLVRQEMSTTSGSMAQASLVASYLWYHIHDGQALATGLYYVALPPNVVTIDENAISSLTYSGAAVSHFISSGTPAISGTLPIALLALLSGSVYVATTRRKILVK
jgi:phosphate transport system substrate-binding protein